MAMVSRVNPQQAYEKMSVDPKAVLLDVRTKIEFDYVGHPIGAVHLPWKEYPDLQVKTDFVSSVRALLQMRTATPIEQTPLFLLCRSGARSLAAAEELARHGFKEVYNIEEGFEGEKDANNHRSTTNGWRFRGLPWEQT